MRNNRKKSSLSNSSWAKYAAGAAAILGTQLEAGASITVIDVNSEIRDPEFNGEFETFGPFGIGAGASFSMVHALDETAVGDGVLFIKANGNVSFAGSAGTQFVYAQNVAFDQAISARSNFVIDNNTGTFGGVMAWGGGYGNPVQSQFVEPGRGYLGYRFDVGDGTQYGWVEVEMSGNPENTATLVRYAYADAGVAINAGQVSKIPEPGSLGMLALGSVALLAWRKKRAA